MPYTTVTTNQVPTASFLNTNYRDQVISTVTSSTRPAGTEGQVIYETDTNLLQIYSGSGWVELGRWGAWTTWTPDYTYGGAARTPTSPTGRWMRQGGVIYVEFEWTPQSTESGSAVVLTNLPATPQSTFDAHFLVNHNAVSYRAIITGGTIIFRELASATPMPLNNTASVSGLVIYEV